MGFYLKDVNDTVMVVRHLSENRNVSIDHFYFSKILPFQAINY